MNRQQNTATVFLGFKTKCHRLAGYIFKIDTFGILLNYFLEHHRSISTNISREHFLQDFLFVFVLLLGHAKFPDRLWIPMF